MAQYHGCTFPVNYFPDADYLHNGVVLRGELLSGLAANTRTMGEWIGGAAIGDTPSAPLTPHGNAPGHDHSGGVMGRPFQITLWQASFGYPEDLMDANTIGGRALRTRTTSAISGAPMLSNKLQVLWIPGCPIDGAYQHLVLEVRCYATAACQMMAKWDHLGSVSEQRLTLGAAAITSLRFTDRVRLKPGEHQDVFFSVSAEYTAATSDVSLIEVALHQTSDSP